MRFASAPLRIVGALLVLLGLLGLYAARVLFHSGHFAEHVAASLDDRRVSGYVAGQLTNVLLEQRPGLTPASSRRWSPVLSDSRGMMSCAS